MPLTISIIPKGFDEAANALAHLDKAFPNAVSGAINYGLRAGNTLAAKLITQRYNIKSAAIKKQGLEVHKANYQKLAGQLAARGPMLPVSEFDPSVKVGTVTPQGKVRKGKGHQYVSVKILKKGGKQIIKGAFQAKGRIWERRPIGTKDRDVKLGIVSTVGVPFMVGYLGIAKQIEDKIAYKTEERLIHNVNFELSKAPVHKPAASMPLHHHHP